MNLKLDITETIEQSRVINIPGLVWRSFRGAEDFPKMLAVVHACAERDGLERAETLEDVVNNYTHLHNSNPVTDMLFAEVNNEVVGYCRTWWDIEGSGQWIGFQLGYVLPDWRYKGIGSALLHFNEERLAQIANQLKESGQLPDEAACLLDNFLMSTEIDRITFLEKRGYKPVRYSFEMNRPDLEDIPELPLPANVEVREVKPEHMRLIWQASNEAFRDHWGYIPDPWEGFEQMMNDPDFDPSLFQVAWQGDEIAGMVLGFINKDENEKYGRKRGYTENICVRRPWRRQGLAKALIARCLIALKQHGMSEAGLGVDAENISGALNLYKYMGYKVIKKGMIYRKPLDLS